MHSRSLESIFNPSRYTSIINLISVTKQLALSEDRTHDLQIMRLTRCLLRYQGMLWRWTSQTGLDPIVTVFDGLFFQKIYILDTGNFYTIFIQVFNLYYKNMMSISLIVLKLCAFRKRSNFGNFQQFFHHKFRLKLKFWILINPLEISSLDLSECTIFTHKRLTFAHAVIFACKIWIICTITSAFVYLFTLEICLHS